LRDGVGIVVDTAFDPLSWARFDGDDALASTRGVVGGLAMREELLDPIDSIRATSIDPYARFRSLNAFMRESDIQNGATNTEGLPDFDAPLDVILPGASDVEADVQVESEVPPAPLAMPVALNAFDQVVLGGAALD
jgi:hypothetical protein